MGMDPTWGVRHQSAGWIHAHLDQAARIELDLASEEHGLIVLRFRIELELSGCLMSSEGHMDFSESRGWGIGVQWIGRDNGDWVAVRGVDSMYGCERNGIGHGGLTWHGIML